MNAPLPAAATGTAPERERRQAEVVTALGRVLPAHALLWRREETVPYECDGLTAYREQPLAVALPETERQVADVLATCHRLAVPVVARGAGTGLSGGALPDPLGVTLSLAKFNRIVAIDPKARTATVQSGVRNLAISEAAAPHRLFYAPDPSSQIACTIGGNVAENSGGVHCLKYGLTLHNVLKVRGFTAAGEAVTFGGDALDSPGLDLLAAVIGSEGMLAVIFEVTVRLLPTPETARCIMASFADVRHAGDAVAAIIGAGIIPAGLEMMDKRMTAAVEDFVHAGYDLDAAAILLCESDGTAAAVEHETQHIADVLAGCGATRIEASENEAQRLRFWSGRKNAFPASGRSRTSAAAPRSRSHGCRSRRSSSARRPCARSPRPPRAACRRSRTAGWRRRSGRSPRARSPRPRAWRAGPSSRAPPGRCRRRSRARPLHPRSRRPGTTPSPPAPSRASGAGAW